MPRTKSSQDVRSIQIAKIQPIKRISVSEEIAQQIMELIAKGDLLPGELLPSERELCRLFGTGRSSLREALRCLSIMGILNPRVGEGTTVAKDGSKFLGKLIEWRLISERHEIEDLLEVRTAIECVAAAKVAASRRHGDIDRLTVLIKKMKAALEDAHGFAALDLEFHVTIAELSGNNLLRDLTLLIRSQLARSLSTMLALPGALRASLKEHIAILHAIRSGVSDAARKAMHDHLSLALDRYRKGLATKRRSSASETNDI